MYFDVEGNFNMVDVGIKKVSCCIVCVCFIVVLGDEIMDYLEGQELYMKKGLVFQIVVLAGIMAFKKIGEFIFFCYLLGLDNCEVYIQVNEQCEVVIDCIVCIIVKIGVEMEVLIGVIVVVFMVYDMCKVFFYDIVIKEIKFMEKIGGKWDFKCFG